MERFVREQMAFVGLADADIETIHRTAPLVLKHEPAITEALYDHFLRFPEAAKFFVGEDGAADLPRLERRKHSLGRWLRETAEVAMTHGFVYYLLAIALSHSHR
ncbi:MAG: protoglobin family protein, partial [Methanomassiliicoccales archaeon]|nr:protoglobin family protein [Methanomassiliicoccales archaeon]